ncbi:MAG: bifunctional 2-polyprenyl-6-hydroxyphenol methylase/3-demethylubiquinol 3-O-methyltransferase UbiG [Zymomonas mobilis subsp. pomaceae]|uniref:Ubiquinone biosynthesis O-methyltransferase n=1 Tax=Zymomonas mobilis subsp. pomaceae (strain ATCC 29192 / DSM 22645 / JCM 10191 / CCUG 17912 / NBRC 13757 / NCIMB 11200 / NRRL B-4491 / Barker I) TaxID=579138 RepID=F8EVL4_ZYMMT|nr:bifunctional 2-polyprenyl-6-hydroxyphenol methylase/3-demethylubiquinol 3-O-methyltransferase UbiG [Zymomonas mobilis]AEI38351.1 ubiquinone biosynthesis O-methyltransferase [Zymomonas mobilis subsp. pomaceae ATCC 29192]MDX5948040.1 bifunctional 2-polyprenyl-6-hydroxyphenol methylase/3-demethylubiquinol 3-O-methyltransferase UbiG [Zymomonas mobilis subsp. pomaceae]GEB89370.1 ubiquinone biosynthesis O-methyltransferase [Zymomonas mobilis subsp. pomaceae]
MKASAASDSLSSVGQLTDKKNEEGMSTIDRHQAEHFGKMAEEWWNPFGSSAMLHRMNPARLSYIRSAVDRHFSRVIDNIKPLSGKKALDIGCGAGLLAEPLTRLGADVTGMDAAAENIAVAKQHADQQNLKINYLTGGMESLGRERFDLITAMEVLEHVADPQEFINEIADKLKEDGLLILSTPNRTLLSRLMIIDIGETLGGIPTGTHDWNRFLKPEETQHFMENAGLRITHIMGLIWSPIRGFILTENKAVDYLLTAQKNNAKL